MEEMKSKLKLELSSLSPDELDVLANRWLLVFGKKRSRFKTTEARIAKVLERFEGIKETV